MSSTGRTIRRNKLEKGIKKLYLGLIEEGSSSAKYLFKTINTHLYYRANGDDAVIHYWSNNIAVLIDKAITETSTYKKARTRLLVLIDQIIVEAKEVA